MKKKKKQYSVTSGESNGEGSGKHQLSFQPILMGSAMLAMSIQKHLLHSPSLSFSPTVPKHFTNKEKDL
jgi:hypothetical protein